MTGRFGVFSRDLWELREDLARILDAEPRRLASGAPLGCDVVLGSADRRGYAARRLAAWAEVPFRTVAVGPLRSVRPDRDVRTLSLTVEGYGAAQPADRNAARRGLATLRRLRLSWRNDGRDRLPFDRDGRDVVLKIVRRGGREGRPADPFGPARPNPIVAVLADSGEPASLAAAVAARHPGWVAVQGTNPWALFDVAGQVEGQAPEGDLARLARLAGCDVGGSEDETSAEDLFGRCFLDEPVYLDAWTRAVTDFETAADQLDWLRERFLENDRRSVCVGVSRWKSAQIARFLDGPDGPALMTGTAEAALDAARATGGRIVAWETRMPRRLEADCVSAGIPLARLEDGFLRSVGLGAAFMPGASCVLDERGIYYDPGRPSDLEHILSVAEFSLDLVERAARLRREIVSLRLSKYNVGIASRLHDLPADRPVVLVPGQVEDDASVMLGSPNTPTNLALLSAARGNNPDAFLIYKPHPDVEAGLRNGRIEAADALALADRVVADISIVDLFDRIDAVETMTSLAGFEALMRGKRTTVHGRPFYAGWGLTHDLDPPERRGRPLTLDELVAGALIVYPRYLDPVTGQRCPPEILVRRLAAARDAARDTPEAVRAARAAYARARHALLGPIAAALRRKRGAVRDAPPSGQER